MVREITQIFDNWILDVTINQLPRFKHRRLFLKLDKHICGTIY